MKVLALVEARDHVCCRYRISAFERALEASGWSLTIEPLAPGLFSRMAQFARSADFDCVILQRKLLPAWQIGELRRRSRRLIFDFDDAVLYRDSYDRRGHYHRRRRDRFRRTVQVADVVLAGNDFLGGCALEAGASPDQVRVIPTCVETNSARPTPRAASKPGVDLVWIGSRSTMAGLDQRRPLWERIGLEIPEVRLRMICDRFLRFEALRVVGVRWSEASENADVGGGDVGISWVPDDLWSRGKCGLKVLQYQAAGLPVVANPVGVHRELVRPGIDGFLPSSSDEWVEAIRTLVEEPEMRWNMGRAARTSVETRHSVSAWSPSFVAAVAGAKPVVSGPTRRLGRPSHRSKSLSELDR